MEARFTLFDSIPIGICILDTSGNVVFWNTTIELWTGTGRQKIIGKSLESYNPEFTKQYYRDRLEGIRRGGPPVYFSSRIHKALFPSRLPNGTLRSFNISVTPLPPDNGTETYVLFSLLDVTDLESGLDKLQREKQKYANELAQSQALQEELDRKKRLAEEAATVKTRFLANMSHEIRTPLSGVLGFLSLLERTELTEKQKMYLDMIKTSGEVLKNLVNDILDLSRIESDKRPLVRRLSDVRKIAEDIRNVFLPATEKKNITFTIHVTEHVPDEILTDPDAVLQIVMNLVGNAVKFTDKGFVRVDFDFIPISDGQGTLRVSIQDTGIGIPPEKINDIFDYFTQLDDSLTKKAMGTGLGLAIVKGLVEMLAGKVGVESVPHHGTLFIVEIPIVRSGGTTRGHTESVEKNPVDISVSGSSLLVVDDNEINLLYLQAVLSEHGYFVVTTSNGAEAIDILSRHTFDAILVDLQMPDMSGLDLAAHIQAGKTGSRKDIPLIAITAFALEEARIQCLNQGFQDFITKPISERSLLQKLHAVLTSTDIKN